jgi:uncharacterized protein DUF3828
MALWIAKRLFEYHASMSKRLAALLFFTIVLNRDSHAQSLDQARSFVQHVYAGYHSDSYSPAFIHPSATFTPGIIALIRADRQNTPKGYVGALDFDPICGCQDPDGLRVNQLKLVGAAPQRATAFVTLQFGSNPEQENLQLKLLWTLAGWRIDDITSPERLSLRRLLTPNTASKHG